MFQLIKELLSKLSVFSNVFFQLTDLCLKISTLQIDIFELFFRLLKISMWTMKYIYIYIYIYTIKLSANRRPFSCCSRVVFCSKSDIVDDRWETSASSTATVHSSRSAFWDAISTLMSSYSVILSPSPCDATVPLLFFLDKDVISVCKNSSLVLKETRCCILPNYIVSIVMSNNVFTANFFWYHSRFYIMISKSTPT